MKKQIIAISLCCACALQAGWYDDAKEKANSTYESSKESIGATVADAKKSVNTTVVSAKEISNSAYKSSKESIGATVTDAKKSVNTTVESAKGEYDKYNKDKKEVKQKELDACVSKIKDDLPQYGLFLEQQYMDVNSRGEHKILDSYKKLKDKGISPDLKTNFDPSILSKLSQSKSTLEYSSSVISALKIIQKELKKNEKEKLDSLIKQVQFLMFAWTTPMEIASTQNIYDASLLEMNTDMIKSINTNNYDNYTRFIYSLLYVNLINENIVIKKDTSLDIGMSVFTGLGLIGGVLTSNNEDKKGIEIVCKDLLGGTFSKDPSEIILANFSSTLDIPNETITKNLDEIAKNNNLFERPVMFNKNITDLKEVSIIDNPLNDSWYLMVREYMELQDDFYKMKKEVDKIIKILDVLPDTENQIATLKQNLFEVDALYRKFDEVVRFNIIDLPVSIYADLYYIEFQKGKKWYNDDEKAMGDIAVSYNKACANMQKYMVSEYAIEKVMRITKSLKSEFDEETEWKEVKTRAKLTQDWFNMLNKVEIKNK